MSKHEKLVVYTDGGARGNPGPAGIGVVVCDAKGRVLKKYHKYLGEKTNNEAEYEAVIAALKIASELAAKELKFNLDSELVVRQLNNIYRVKNHRMQGLMIRLRNLEAKFKKITYRHISREQNQLADELVNLAIDRHGNV